MTTYGLLIFDGAEELDFVGPWEVFTISAMLREDAGTVVLIAERPDAGPARGRKVATYYAFEDTLQARGDVTVVRDARYVVDGNLITSQGVSAGIDMALWLVGRIHGRDHARAVRRHIQYEPAPPYLADEPLA